MFASPKWGRASWFGQACHEQASPRMAPAAGQHTCACFCTHEILVHAQQYTINRLAYVKLRPKSDREPVAYLDAQVYAENKRFEYEEDLRDAIVHEWEKSTDYLLRTYIKSIPKRCLDDIGKLGGSIS
eukprot:IDg14006t1